MPPLALLAAALALATAATGAAAIAGVPGPFLAAMGLDAVFAGSIGLAWWNYCRWQVPVGSLAAVPIYLVQKVPIYLRLLAGGTTTWVRTPRRTVG